MARYATLLLTLLTVMTPVWGQETGSRSQKTDCPMVKVRAERLPDLNIPRAEHVAFCANGELTVIGGHTSGFVPMATAEYYRDGAWHQLPTTYPHDFALGLPLSSGQVLIAGGQEQSLGIGQSFTVERYDPVNHRFEGFGCMDNKRALFSGVELDSGRVMLTGNWYHDDGIELFDGHQSFTAVKPTTVPRSAPYVFRTSRTNAIIVGSADHRGQPLDSIIVDRLHGEPFSVPLLQRWCPMYQTSSNHPETGFIGDMDKGIYVYLMAVQDYFSPGVEAERQGHPAGNIAVMLVRGEEFSLLPTTCPVPLETKVGGAIYYQHNILANRKAGRAYMTGVDKDLRFYVLAIDYTQRPAPLTLYYTDPLPDFGFGSPVLTDEGNLAVMGGSHRPNFVSNNFTPVASAWIIHFDDPATAESATTRWWLWALLPLVAVAVLLWWLHRRKHEDTVPETPETAIPQEADEALMGRIRQLMDEQQLYLNSELKLSDVAAALSTNSRYVSDCIKSCEGCQFADFIKRYRIEHAKQLLRQQSDKKVSTIYLESGFATESSFFRAFKSLTGMTPREWIVRQHQ